MSRTSKPESVERCAHCDSPVNDGECHPVVTAMGGDGAVRSIYSFCNEECKSAWNGED